MTADDALAWLEWHLEQYKRAESVSARAYHSRQVARFAADLAEIERPID